jgi:hypothetical protein
MYNSDTELIFPLRAISALRDLRGETWQALVDYIQSPDASAAENAAFVLLVVRTSGCVACNADSFRAMRGCTQCARQAIKRFRGSDSDLITLYNQYVQEVKTYDEQQKGK